MDPDGTKEQTTKGLLKGSGVAGVLSFIFYSYFQLQSGSESLPVCVNRC